MLDPVKLTVLHIITLTLMVTKIIVASEYFKYSEDRYLSVWDHGRSVWCALLMVKVAFGMDSGCPY